MSKVDSIASGQERYLDRLTKMIADGETTIRVFDAPNNQWSTIPIQPFYDIQKSQLVDQQFYSSKLNEAQDSAQKSADKVLADVVVPPMEGYP